MRRLLLFALLAGCSNGAPAPSDELAAVTTRLAPFRRPAPPGALAIRVDANVVTIARAGQPGVEIGVTADETKDAVFHVIEEGRFEELRRIDRRASRVSLGYTITLGPALRTLRATGPIVEALDDRGAARLRTEPAIAVDAVGVVRSLAPSVEGSRVTWTLDAEGMIPPIAVDPAWIATSSLVYARQGARPMSIPGKKMILIGGAPSETISVSEIYDDATGTFTIGPAMSRPRLQTTPERMGDGRIILVAGVGADEFPPTADVYDPATGKFTKTSGMPGNFFGNETVAVPDGVLVHNNQRAARWNAKTDTWTLPTPGMLGPRVRSLDFALSSGKVIILGGKGDSGFLSTMELFDPATNTFSALPSLPSFRMNFAAALVKDQILVAGGSNGDLSGAVLDTTEIYDIATKTWTAGPKLVVARSTGDAALLPDGRVLLAGGLGPTGLIGASEVIDLTAKTSIAAGTLSAPRAAFLMMPIVDGEARMMAAGGYNGGITGVVDIWAPVAIGGKCTGAGECANGLCADGVCCETAKCAEGETCGGAAGAGKCRKIAGKTCAAASDCASGFCVDGVCCDRACDGTCEACDLAASPGTCATLPPGEAPHGATRAKCPGTAPCTALCGGIDAKACTLFPGAATACAAASCKGGTEASASACDGAGGCTAPKTSKCEPYACGEQACKRACAADADCASGYSCDAHTGRCVFGAKCDGDHTVLVPSAAPIDCTPYKCAGASCLSRCASSDDCVAGTTCDTAGGTCVIATAADAGGGCAFGARSTSPVAMLALLFALRRRRA